MVEEAEKAGLITPGNLDLLEVCLILAILPQSLSDRILGDCNLMLSEAEHRKR